MWYLARSHKNKLAEITSRLNVKSEKEKQLFSDGKQALYDYYALCNEWFLDEEKNRYEKFSLNNYREINNLKESNVRTAKRLYSLKGLIDLIVDDSKVIEVVGIQYFKFSDHFITIQFNLDKLMEEYISFYNDKNGLSKYDNMVRDNAIQNKCKALYRVADNKEATEFKDNMQLFVFIVRDYLNQN